MKVIEVNKNLFKDKLSIYLSKDREFWARKEKAGFSESLNLFEFWWKVKYQQTSEKTITGFRFWNRAIKSSP